MTMEFYLEFMKVNLNFVAQPLGQNDTTMWGILLRSIRPSRVPGLGGLDEIGPRSQVTAHLAGVRIWFNK